MIRQYVWYLARHKWFVFIECCKMGIPWAGITHDLSKFLPDEFLPYARSFYGKQGRTPEVRAAFDAAWLLHQHRNPHHWQHWVLREDSGKVKALAIPERYRREMIADWKGAGRAMGKGNDVAAWYRDHRGYIQMNVETRAWIEATLHVFIPQVAA